MITTAILTGDIVNSRETSPKIWLPYLKEGLNAYGKEPHHWEVYRGDSFQLETIPERALEAAYFIKAILKQKKGVDVRIAIGLGEKDYHSEKITESNGSAFVHSGECFQNLKKTNLALRSSTLEFDEILNLSLKLMALTADNWLPATARVVKTTLANPEASQKELVPILEKSQSTISEALLRAGYDELQQLLVFYKTKVTQL